jgi:hypothetical protein
VFDYDLYLYDNAANILASSTNGGNTYESFSYENETGAPQTVHLAVRRVSGGNTEFEVFWHGSSAAIQFQYFVSASSTTSPSNSTHLNVISNAAVDWSDEERRLVTGFLVYNTAPNVAVNARRIDPRVFCGIVPEEMRYDADTNPT